MARGKERRLNLAQLFVLGQRVQRELLAIRCTAFALKRDPCDREVVVPGRFRQTIIEDLPQGAALLTIGAPVAVRGSALSHRAHTWV